MSGSDAEIKLILRDLSYLHDRVSTLEKQLLPQKKSRKRSRSRSRSGSRSHNPRYHRSRKKSHSRDESYSYRTVHLGNIDTKRYSAFDLRKIFESVGLEEGTTRGVLKLYINNGNSNAITWGNCEFRFPEHRDTVLSYAREIEEMCGVKVMPYRENNRRY